MRLRAPRQALRNQLFVGRGIGEQLLVFWRRYRRRYGRQALGHERPQRPGAASAFGRHLRRRRLHGAHAGARLRGDATLFWGEQVAAGKVRIVHGRLGRDGAR